MLSIASQLLTVALVLAVPSTLLTPGGAEFMVQAVLRATDSVRVHETYQ